MMPKQPSTCTRTDCTAALVEDRLRIRRGDRILAVPVMRWRCAGCGEFSDPALFEVNRQHADAAWQEAFGVPLPETRPPGRKPLDPLTERVVALLTPQDLEQIDAARGKTPRSEFIREAAQEKARAMRRR